MADYPGNSPYLGIYPIEVFCSKCKNIGISVISNETTTGTIIIRILITIAVILLFLPLLVPLLILCGLCGDNVNSANKNNDGCPDCDLIHDCCFDCDLAPKKEITHRCPKCENLIGREHDSRPVINDVESCSTTEINEQRPRSKSISRSESTIFTLQRSTKLGIIETKNEEEIVTKEPSKNNENVVLKF